MKTLLIIFVVSIFLTSAGFVLSAGISKMELTECYKWQDYEAKYPIYETSTTTAQRCLSRGVNVFEFVD